MSPGAEGPRVFRTLRGDAIETTTSAYGSVGRLFTGEGLELVWVRKENEEVDPGWFSQSAVDLIVVLQGGLRCEFDDPASESTNLCAGDVLILPADTRCRAYRWRREQRDATIFIAIYPKP